ncbi:MAG: PLP-dependent aminotransferase family protein [Candidatus Competibacteraceae bacterium]
MDPLWVSRQSLETDATVLKPGCGWLPAAWLYETGMRRAPRSARAGRHAELTEYATPLGRPALRQLLSRRRTGCRHHKALPEQIMLTESGMQAIDLICRFLLEPGDTVLVDDPVTSISTPCSRRIVRVVGVPYTLNGSDVERFEAALRAHSLPGQHHQFRHPQPDGATLSPVTAHQLLKRADSSGLVIVEDDIFADFEVSPAPTAAFDGLSRVIHIGSFSKTVSPRCVAAIAARSDWIESLTDLKIATTFGGSDWPPKSR